MKWVKVDHEGNPTYGVLSGSKIKLTTHSWSDVLANKSPDDAAEIDQASAVLLNPIERPGKIVCVGLNYMDHCVETGIAPPERPLLFSKFTTAMTGPGSDITWSTKLSAKVDFEAELAVVISKTCRRVSEEDALDYVAGYTAANDVSARDVQLGDGQWVRGKSLDSFCPVGPALVSSADIPDPQNLVIRTFLNGEIMQDSSTSLMIFSIAHIISFCSQAFTLEPGDIILTGTPHGVGMGRDPEVYLNDGDLIEIEIEKIGRLSNRCRCEG